MHWRGNYAFVAFLMSGRPPSYIDFGFLSIYNKPLKILRIYKIVPNLWKLQMCWNLEGAHRRNHEVTGLVHVTNKNLK